MSIDASHASSFEQVQDQYESFPYPPRDPEDERKRLKRTYIDSLEVINHYGFQGRRDMRLGLRVLVAGGGTGDAAIHLAEQLRDTPQRVTYLDISSASMDIARRRAEIRGLTNIDWVQSSLLELPKLGVGPFDYIDCAGVLHHLPEPQAGLEALCGVLADDGVMGLMLYAKYGRTGVYQMQEMLRLMNRFETTATARIENTRRALRSLPESNWFKKGDQFFIENEESSDADIYDLLLHSTDQAYSVPELYTLLETCGLNLIEFNPELRARYRPKFVVTDPELLTKVLQLPLPEQQAVAELYNGSITRHEFFASRRADSAASFDCLENVPFFGIATAAMGTELTEQLWDIRFTQAVRIRVQPSPLAAAFVKLVDGQRTLAEILETLTTTTTGGTTTEIYNAMREAYELLNLADVLLLRHQSVELYRPLESRGL